MITCCANLQKYNSDFIWLVTDGNNFFIFTYGRNLNYRFYPIDDIMQSFGTFDQNLQESIENGMNYSYFIDDIVPSQTQRLADFNRDTSYTNEVVLIEMINNPFNKTFEFKLYLFGELKMQVVKENVHFTGGLETQLSLYCFSHEFDEFYSINTIQYSKELEPTIEFKATVDADEDLLEKFSSVYSGNDDKLSVVVVCFVKRVVCIFFWFCFIF